MRVFKFGGASLRNATAIKNAARIIGTNQPDGLVVVVSAMDKTTSALERVLAAVRQHADAQQEITELFHFHWTICNELFSPDHAIFDEIKAWGKSIAEALTKYDNEDCV